MSSPIPRFCGLCGGPLVERFVDGEQCVRRVCAHCGVIAYRNPQVLVSTIVAAGDRVLLCRRMNPPAAGQWALPGGFMECGETLEDAAARETFEETGVRCDPRALRLHALSTLPEVNEVYVGFLASVAEDTDTVCGSECADVRFFDETTLPWIELAYPDVAEYLRLYFRERRSSAHAIHFSRLDAAGVISKAYRIAEIENSHRHRVTLTTPKKPP